MWRVFYAYLRVALALGCHGHVYRLCQKWGRDQQTERWTNRYSAAFDIQPLLLKSGYHKCPECSWVTEKPNEHIVDSGTRCYEYALSKCPVCNGPRYPEDMECRFCLIDKDVKHGLALAVSMDDVPGGNTVEEATAEVQAPAEPAVEKETVPHKKRVRQEDLCKCGEHMLKAGSRWICPTCDM